MKILGSMIASAYGEQFSALQIAATMQGPGLNPMNPNAGFPGNRPSTTILCS